MTDQEHADAIRAAQKALNDTIEAAAEHGLTVKVFCGDSSPIINKWPNAELVTHIEISRQL